MKITSESFKPGAAIPERFALCRKDAKSHVAMAENQSPQLAWSELPAGTKSLALICHDSDAPTRPDDVNKEGRSVPASLPRADFTHWVLVDLAADTSSLAAGAFSDAVTPRGKPGPEGPRGTRQGLNNYTQWFEGDKDMAGRYFGYDGPCPPWNDELVHHYHFTLYALDVARCPVDGVFTREQVLEAMKGHVLGQASTTGTYTLNPKLG
ncbi:MAG TPA: YbhB/YbcL family Raf kinase inhibitor-like protein [Polyangiales bacterium]|nr:YbhB/YbcL family Raf kinase inhibitor-like protein [Polyangiales bacterium]